MPAAVSSPHTRFIDLSEALIRVPLGPVACSHLMVTEGTVPNGTFLSAFYYFILHIKERTGLLIRPVLNVLPSSFSYFLFLISYFSGAFLAPLKLLAYCRF